MKEPLDKDKTIEDFKKVKDLILGKDASGVKQTFDDNAREIVSNIFTEALNDREQRDGSVNRVMQPLVEESVARSVQHQSDKLVDYLYPLVGKLIRKSIIAFFSEFIEKTNQIVEQSFTAQGLSWRFEAWRTGISYSEIVTSHTFKFKVEKVFLIHKETGILLNAASADGLIDENADIVSGMLTAINDFVSDSFVEDNKKGNKVAAQEIQNIQMDNLTLVVNISPSAILVAVVKGKLTVSANQFLQQTLEEIQSIYGQALKDFGGDATPFERTNQQLTECLLNERFTPKPKNNSRKNAIVAMFISFAIIFFGVYGYFLYTLEATKDLISSLDEKPGITIVSSEADGLFNVDVSILRDPNAMDVNEWLETQMNSNIHISVTEFPVFFSEQDVVAIRVNKVLNNFPNIHVSWQDDKVSFSGIVSYSEKTHVIDLLQKVPGLILQSDAFESIQEAPIQGPNAESIDDLVTHQIIGQIEKLLINFESAESILTPIAKQQLLELAVHFLTLQDHLSNSSKSASLMILGTSDSGGSRVLNQRYSAQRAETVRQFLQDNDILAKWLFATGVGELKLLASPDKLRLVVFKVIVSDSQ